MKIKTELLQSLVGRAIKGVSNNRLLPLTSMMLIEVKDSKLTLVTTNGVNYLYIKEDIEDTDDIYVVVNADTFAKLVQKTTSSYIILTIKEDYLSFKGNGTYKLDITLDENGEPLEYPNPLNEIKLENPTKVRLHDLKDILQTNKSALSKTLEIPLYTGYYVGDKVFSTDSFTICCLDVNLGLDAPVLISGDMMDLVNVMILDDVDMYVIGNKIVLDSSDTCIYGDTLEGIENYPIKQIADLVNIESEYSCDVDTSVFLSVLDRLTLFVSPYDKNSITLTFDEDELKVFNKNASSYEVIEYLDSSNATNFTCSIDVTMLTSQLKATHSDNITVGYGLPNAIKLSNANVVQVLALLED